MRGLSKVGLLVLLSAVVPATAGAAERMSAREFSQLRNKFWVGATGSELKVHEAKLATSDDLRFTRAILARPRDKWKDKGVTLPFAEKRLALFLLRKAEFHLAPLQAVVDAAKGDAGTTRRIWGAYSQARLDRIKRAKATARDELRRTAPIWDEQSGALPPDVSAKDRAQMKATLQDLPHDQPAIERMLDDHQRKTKEPLGPAWMAPAAKTP